eukprot:TRINITY_DN644_c0_g1_i1.p1 TRINITY_DN644_c0_g1~~TRINITY_DN644_c0_g1_i1.p1  ORF type:complete len:112 (+),score=12.61 TRINITY_DN644_c0_g1_i1:166-501(+)
MQREYELIPDDDVFEGNETANELERSINLQRVQVQLCVIILVVWLFLLILTRFAWYVYGPIINSFQLSKPSETYEPFTPQTKDLDKRIGRKLDEFDGPEGSAFVHLKPKGE